MHVRKFDISCKKLRFDRETRALAMTVQPLAPDYDEAALIRLGWGVMAGCPELRRLVIEVEVDDGTVVPLRRVA